MIGTDELLMYDIAVPWIGEYCGGPSRFGVNCGPFLRGTVAVCGIEFSITATCASGVPATVGRTAPASEAGGIFANPEGSASPATKVHGPVMAVERNQRPARSTQELLFVVLVRAS